jgi:hypothetical protein
MGHPDDRRLCDPIDEEQGALHLHRREPVARHVDHTVHPAVDPKVIVLVEERGVRGVVAIGPEPTEVLGAITPRVTPDRARKRRERGSE